MRIKNFQGFAKFLYSCALVIRTSVGVGMLGMPVEMGKGGAVPGSFALVFIWLGSLISGLLLLEVLSIVKKEVNYSTLAETFIGYGSKIYLSLVYFLLFLSLLFAYVKGGGVWIADFSTSMPVWLGALIFLLFFLPIIIHGAKVIGKVNFFLLVIMFFSFFIMITIGIKDISFENLSHSNWGDSFLSLPLVVTAFGFHIIIPSLYAYMDKRKVLMRWIIIIGTTATLFMYLIWNSFILGIIPLNGEISLNSTLLLDQTAISPLKRIIASPLTTFFAQIFYFSALATSFLGVGLATLDFSIDTFQIKKTKQNRLLISIVIFFPAFLLAGTNLRLFYLSLKYGAGFACVLLLILFPAVLIMKIPFKIKKEILPKTYASKKKWAVISIVFGSIIIAAQCISIF